MTKSVFIGAAVAAFAVGGVVAIVYPGKDVAGATRVALVCEVRVSDADRTQYSKAGLDLPRVSLKDGGVSLAASKYTTVVVGAWKNPDGGLVYPKLDFGEVLDPGASCQETPLVAAGVDAGELKASTLRCACSSGALCTVGGKAAPMGVTLQPGAFLGLGCVGKSCGPELLGEQGATWPEGCPQ